MTVVMKIDLVGPRAPRPRARPQRGGRLRRRRARGRAERLAGSRVRRPRRARRRRRGDRGHRARRCRSLFVRDTADHVALEQTAPSRPRRRPRRRRCATRSPTRPGACRRCAPARRPGSSTTSTTRSPGAWSRCSSPPTARASAQIGLVAGLYPGGLGRRADLDRPLVRPRRAQAADRRRHARPSRGARRCSPPRDGDVAIAAAAAVLLGVGTALVYPTLIAAISDAVTPVARAPMVGVYRFWRDMGYVAGGADRRRRRRRASASAARSPWSPRSPPRQDSGPPETSDTGTGDPRSPATLHDAPPPPRRDRRCARRRPRVDPGRPRERREHGAGRPRAPGDSDASGGPPARATTSSRSSKPYTT